MEEKKEDDNNKGCIIFGVIAILSIWGFASMMGGGTFVGGINENIEALFTFIGIGIVAIILYFVFGNSSK